MADILIDNQTAPTTPNAGKCVVFTDLTTKKMAVTDDTGVHRGVLSRNFSTANQGAGFATDTYVTNSGLLVPSFGIQAGMAFRWTIGVSKTAAGTAATAVQFRVGANQSTADTSLVTATATVAQTAAIAEGIIIAQMLVRTASASGVVAVSFGVCANGPGLGGGKDAVSGSVDLTGKAGQYVGISINGGASAAWTVTSVAAELIS